MEPELYKVCEEIVKRDVIMDCSLLVEDLLALDLEKGQVDLNRSMIENPDPDGEEYEWHFVSEWLYHRVRAEDFPVIDSAYGYIWGRCTTGQLIVMDAIIEKLAREILEDRQKYSP